MNSQKPKISGMNNKVCMLVHNYFSIDPRVRREACALVERGYNVDVIALKEKQGKFRFELDGINVYQLPLRKTRDSIYSYLLTYALLFVFSTFILTFLYTRNRYRLIQVHNMPNFIVFTSLIPKLFGSKVLLDIHDPMPELFMSKFSVSAKSVPIKILRAEEKASMRFADKIITATEMVRERLVKALNNMKDVDVILNLPDKSKIKFDASSNTGCESDKFILLYHGTIAKRHGLGIVVHALPEIRKVVPNVQFVIIGNGEYRDELKSLVKDLKLEKTVVFKDLIPHEQIAAEILKSSAVICVPANDVFIEMALSTKVLETLALKKPVIISKNKCNQYYFEEDEVYFVDPDKTESIVEAVKKVFETGKKQHSVKDLIYARVSRKFDWDVEKIRYLEIVEDLMA